MVLKTIKQPKNKFIKITLIILGLMSLVLGVIGVFLPLLPTTPFLILSAALFLRSSTRLYNWLINHKYLGKYLYNIIHHKTIPIRTKIYAISLMWITITLSTQLVINSLIIKILLFIIAIGVTIYILSFKSIPEKC